MGRPRRSHRPRPVRIRGVHDREHGALPDLPACCPGYVRDGSRRRDRGGGGVEPGRRAPAQPSGSSRRAEDQGIGKHETSSQESVRDARPGGDRESARLFIPAPAIQRDFDEVVRGPMRVTIDEEGETPIHDRFVVSAPVAGRVLRIELEPGDTVRAGRTTIATFLPAEPALLDVRSRAEAEARVRVVEASMGRAQATRDRVREELAFADYQLERYEELAEQGLVATERLDMTRSNSRPAANGKRSTRRSSRCAMPSRPWKLPGQSAAGSPRCRNGWEQRDPPDHHPVSDRRYRPAASTQERSRCSVRGTTG